MLKLQKENGFTMIEIVIAILILGIISTVIVGAANITSSSILRIGSMQKANALAELQMEYVKKLGYSSSYPRIIDDPLIDIDFAADYPGYEVMTFVSPVGLDIDLDGTIETGENARDNNIQKITVRVWYKDTTLENCLFSAYLGGVLVTKPGHGLTTGDTVIVTGTLIYDDEWSVTVSDSDSFTLNSAVYSNPATGTVYKKPKVTLEDYKVR